MKGRIISCFSCSGKTHYVLNNCFNEDCVDHDFYDWMYRGNLGDTWLIKYLARMKDLQKKFEYVYVNTLPTILSELPKDSILIYPKRDLKTEYFARANLRNAGSNFPNTLLEKWDYWIDACEEWEGKKFILKSGQYISDIMKRFYGITC